MTEFRLNICIFIDYAKKIVLNMVKYKIDT